MTNFLVMFVGIEFTREALELGIACSRLSDSGKDAKVKGTRKSFFDKVGPVSIQVHPCHLLQQKTVKCFYA